VDASIRVITLGVRDVERSRRFYVDGLGWRPTLELPEVVFVQVGHGLLLALFGAADLEVDAGAPDHLWQDGPGSPRFSLGSNVDSEAEVDRAFDRAVGSGAVALKPPQRASWGGYHAYWCDPDGYVWEIVHNPGLTVGSDGTVSFADAT
jgi:uncharacterized protein